MKEILDLLSIDKTLFIAGTVGAIAGIKGGGKKAMLSRASGFLMGVAGAVYLTPLTSELLDIQNEKSKLGIAVIIGYLGIRGIQELIINKLNAK